LVTKGAFGNLITLWEKIGEYLSLHEICLSNGELYTILTNKAAHGKKASIVAIVKGTKAEDVIDILKKILMENVI